MHFSYYYYTVKQTAEENPGWYTNERYSFVDALPSIFSFIKR